MLIRFVVNNFSSFGSEKEFNMIAGNFKTHKNHIYKFKGINLLKAAAIYGANGAGKSNLVLALRILKDLMEGGEIDYSMSQYKFRLNPKNSNNPITFEIEFSIKNKIYYYLLSVNDQSIVEESLYETSVNKEDNLIFERKQVKGKTKIAVSGKYKATSKQKILIELMEDTLLKTNETFLSKSDTVKIPELKLVREWAENNLLIIFPGTTYNGLVKSVATSEQFAKFSNDLLEAFETGIHELGIESTSLDKFLGDDDEDFKNEIVNTVDKNGEALINHNGEEFYITKQKDKYVVMRVVAYHKGTDSVDVPFNISEESDGTIRLLDFIPAFDLILKKDVTVVIDEIDQSLHPVLLKGLVAKLMSNPTTKGQLIFTTHESNLLDLEIFRQDEIWFAEKDRETGSTQIYSLSDFKPRYDLDVRKGYLKGRFGAIPFLANLNELNWSNA